MAVGIFRPHRVYKLRASEDVKFLKRFLTVDDLLYPYLFGQCPFCEVSLTHVAFCMLTVSLSSL